ncbi:MAG: arginine--tRNA ligase [Epsilonproteobacteria bacterium]|nr:arginine--tRNA ligase [Campylobacterota bacterium]
MQLKSLLSEAIRDSFKELNITPKTTQVNEAAKPEFGDFQYNGVMALAKELKENPREIANRVALVLKENPLFERVEVAGPGFINLRIDKKFLEDNLLQALDSRAGVREKEDKIRVVVDYSSPNMAKQMHVGHLRSTVIGDALANLFEFLGDEVIRQNHIGDWGTQFGMLIAYFEENAKERAKELSDLERFYQAAKKRFDEDEEFATKAREYVVKLQSGDKECLRLWREFIDTTLAHTQEIYDKLGVKLGLDDVRGESFYNSDLPNLVEELEQKGVAKESEGAKCIFFEDKAPLIIQKKDGGYLYATTDLAAIKYRVQELKAKRISYVVDARQSEHFKQVFETAKRAKIVDDSIILEHIAFGMVLDKSGKPFKTREGGTIKLKDLIDEAVRRAREIIGKDRDYSDEELEHIAKVVGVGALKYADLSINRLSNYVFDWDKMLSLDGNTALYMQYAYARINSILRKAPEIESKKVIIGDELEKKLALKILSFEDILNRAYIEAMPHLITNYLYELAGLFMKFYENNPILKEGVKSEIRDSRLLLAKATANVIKKGLNILGIEVVERI